MNDEVTGDQLDYVFAASWQSPDGKQQIMATFTKSISTFTGETVVRVQFGSKGENQHKAGRKARLSGAVEKIYVGKHVLTQELAAIIKKENPDEKPKDIWDNFILPELDRKNITQTKAAVPYLAKQYAIKSRGG